MSDVYFERTEDRAGFVDKYVRIADFAGIVKGKSVLVKPNIVSFEPYPTTTHPETLQAVLKHLKGNACKTVVADGPACDCKTDLKLHLLGQICDSLNVDFVNLSTIAMKNVWTKSGFDLEVSSLVFDFDFIISLPVLKSHYVCGLTGALKNQYGILSSREKRDLHFAGTKDLHKAIAELSRIRKPDFYIVDAVETLIGAQEIRHGGKIEKLGYVFAGTDPVSLDSFGFELLKNVERRLHRVFRKCVPQQIKHIKYAIDFGVGEPEFVLHNLGT